MRRRRRSRRRRGRRRARRGREAAERRRRRRQQQRVVVVVVVVARRHPADVAPVRSSIVSRVFVWSLFFGALSVAAFFIRIIRSLFCLLTDSLNKRSPLLKKRENVGKNHS